MAALDNICVVMVGTLQAGNIGSAARAMKNMGLSRLKLVCPAERINDECRMMAAGALDLVESARVFSTLDEALADEQLVVGTTSSRERRQRQRLWTPRRLAPLIRRRAESHRVALLFGPERGGLDDVTLSRCRYLVSIPASRRHPVLNVAQSVMVLAYEVYTARAEGPPAPGDLATDAEREQMFAQLEDALTRIGFFAADNQEHLMKSIRNLFVPELSRRDVRIVRGMMSQLKWYAEGGFRFLADRRKNRPQGAADPERGEP